MNELESQPTCSTIFLHNNPQILSLLYSYY